MPAGKIVDEREAEQWILEGRTYAWIVEEYRRKYNIETTISMWGNFRRRKDIDTRIVRNEDLLPWRIKEEHRWQYPPMMLRALARRRAGRPNAGDYEERLDSWLKACQDEDTVVHYDPDTDDGWFYVPRRPGVDTDVIRVPDDKMTQEQRAALARNAPEPRQPCSN